MIFPNLNAGRFCTWLLTANMFRLTPGRIVQITAIQTAANTQTSVTDTDYDQFIQYTGRMYYYYQQWQNMQPIVPVPTSLDPLTTAWLAAVATPSNQTIYSVDTFFKQLRNDGNLLLDYFYLFAQDIQANAKIELFNPGTRNIIEQGSPIWTANQGYTGNGSTMYLDTGFINNVHGVNFTLNSGCYGIYGRLALPASTALDMGANEAATNAYLGFRYGGNNYALINSLTAIALASTNTQGLLFAQRTTANAIALFLNNTLLVSDTANPAISLNTISDFILAINSVGSPGYFSSNQIACAFKGSGAINQTLFNSAVNTLMVNLGAHF